MKKKLASAITAGALALTTVAVAPEASAAPTNNSNVTNAKADTSDFSSQAGDVIALLVFGAVFLGIYGFFSPYNPNGAWANAAG